MCLITYEYHNCGHVSDQHPLYISNCQARTYEAEEEAYGIRLGRGGARCREERTAKFKGSDFCTECKRVRSGGAPQHAVRRGEKRRVEERRGQGEVEQVRSSRGSRGWS
jgi:hypothetical protein